MKRTMIGLLACMALAACETVQGAGRDLQNAGRAVEQAVGRVTRLGHTSGCDGLGTRPPARV